MAVSAAYLASAAQQMGSISAFLGGFSATFLATLLMTTRRSRAAGITIGASAVSAVGFIVSVLASTTLAGGLHPDAPAGFNPPEYLNRVQMIMTLAFGVGSMALLLALGASGWVRSRRLGWLTTSVSLVGLLVVLFLTVRFDADRDTRQDVGAAAPEASAEREPAGR